MPFYVEVLKRQWLGTAKDMGGGNVVSLLTQTYQRMVRAVKQVKVRESTRKRKMKTYYDKNARVELYSVGDRVLVLKPSTGNKLQGAWRGPYKITGVIKPPQKPPSLEHMNSPDHSGRQAGTY